MACRTLLNAKTRRGSYQGGAESVHARPEEVLRRQRVQVQVPSAGTLQVCAVSQHNYPFGSYQPRLETLVPGDYTGLDSGN